MKRLAELPKRFRELIDPALRKEMKRVIYGDEKNINGGAGLSSSKATQPTLTHSAAKN